MKSIYTDQALPASELELFLHRLFPALRFFPDDMESAMMPEGFDPTDDRHKLYQTLLETDRDEFCFSLHLYRLPEQHPEALNQYIALRLAQDFGRRTLVSFSIPEKPYDPFYDLIFEAGKIFLADDLETAFGQDGTANVKYLQEYALTVPAFDERGFLKDF